jgi:uncharacterized membrane protein
VLNICDCIVVRVPVDLSILVTWMIVAFAVVGRARACQNFEIGGMFVHLALSCFHKNFNTAAVLFHLS